MRTTQGLGKPRQGLATEMFYSTVLERVGDNGQGLSQDLETGWPKLAIVKFWGVQNFKGDHNILELHSPLTNSSGSSPGANSPSSS